MGEQHYKSVTWWSINVLTLVDILYAIKRHTRLTASGGAVYFVLLLAMIVAVWIFFLMFQTALAESQRATMAADWPQQRCEENRMLLARVGKKGTQLCLAALFLALFAATPS